MIVVRADNQGAEPPGLQYPGAFGQDLVHVFDIELVFFFYGSAAVLKLQAPGIALPIKGRLYPSHYSLLYYCKGEKPNVFHPDRLPMDICPHCVGDLKDYGGYKHKMNPDGVNLSDVWLDIPPVRHRKYKKRNGSNELSVRLLDRIIEMASNEGDVVFDPFGGSGTTYAVAEIKKRKWIGIEIGPVVDIINRFKNIEEDAEYLARIRRDSNCLITEENLRRRMAKGWWTPDSVREKKEDKI